MAAKQNLVTHISADTCDSNEIPTAIHNILESATQTD